MLIFTTKLWKKGGPKLDLLETEHINLLTLDEIKTLVENKREIDRLKHPAAKAILAEFKDDAKKKLRVWFVK